MTGRPIGATTIERYRNPPVDNEDEYGRRRGRATERDNDDDDDGTVAIVCAGSAGSSAEKEGSLATEPLSLRATQDSAPLLILLLQVRKSRRGGGYHVCSVVMGVLVAALCCSA